MSRTLLGRLGETNDVATAVLFLVSDEASFIIAQVLTVDGGRSSPVTSRIAKALSCVLIA